MCKFTHKRVNGLLFFIFLLFLRESVLLDLTGIFNLFSCLLYIFYAVLRRKYQHFSKSTLGLFWIFFL